MDKSFQIFKRPTLVAMLFRANMNQSSNFEMYDAKIHSNGQVSCLWAGLSDAGSCFLTASQEVKLRRLKAI